LQSRRSIHVNHASQKNIFQRHEDIIDKIIKRSSPKSTISQRIFNFRIIITGNQTATSASNLRHKQVFSPITEASAFTSASSQLRHQQGVRVESANGYLVTYSLVNLAPVKRQLPDH